MKQAVCILIEKDGLFLGVSRKENHNDFGLPGGKVDENETLEEAIIRELKEETGLDVKDLVPVLSEFCNTFNVTTFTGVVDGEIFSNENAIVKWVTKEDLMSGSFNKYNTKLFKKLNYIKDI